MAVGAITQKFIVCVGWGDDDGYEFSLHIVMRSIVTALITLAVLGVLILDGSGMFMAYQGACEVARTAAYQAALEYLSTDGNEAAAKQTAAASFPSVDRYSRAAWYAAVRATSHAPWSVSYTHLRAHETDSYLVCRLLLEKKKNN